MSNTSRLFIEVILKKKNNLSNSKKATNVNKYILLLNSVYSISESSFMISVPSFEL